ncbi:hemopexin repeat-containing protein [Streptomyces sp. KS 21]|uniref:hemopexin repeat-containing protein n=1 Tax=Streptomyces sp. KS 21 TaxID=2485150 RepID=UPI00106407E1|nr:hemopexin repeat-containing protein [Streptomyces sp. KS 21]TDU73727.1 hemopexin [Streptomyces sp. KS 21]
MAGQFTSNLDAVTHHDGGYWFFKGDQCCKTNDAGTSFKVEPALITKSGRWPILEERRKWAGWRRQRRGSLRGWRR